MTATSKPYGFRPIGTLNGVDWNGQVMRFKKEASVILAVGDPVVGTGTGETATGIPLITRAQGSEGTPSQITGVVVGIDPIRSDLSKTYMAAADQGYVHVCVGTNVLYAIQEDAVGGNIALTALLAGADIVVTNADTDRGLSQVMIDSSTAGTDAQLQLISILQNEDELTNIGSGYQNFVVRINENTFQAATTFL